MINIKICNEIHTPFAVIFGKWNKKISIFIIDIPTIMMIKTAHGEEVVDDKKRTR